MDIPIYSQVQRFLKGRSVIMEFSSPDDAQIRIPEFNAVAAYEKAAESWVLQAIFRTITQETLRSGITVGPKFKSKCTNEKCGKEFKVKVESCDECGGGVRPPFPVQRKRLADLVKKPNGSRQSFKDILSSIIYHDLVADNWYVSVAYAPITGQSGILRPKEIYVEDPRYFAIVSDSRGRLGDPHETFCPICYPEKDTNVYAGPGSCRKCGASLEATAYVQQIGDITNRFGVNDVASGSSHRVLPYLYGTPRLKSIWEVVWTMGAMDEWFFDTYTEGRIGKIINFPGYTPDQVKALAIKIREDNRGLNQTDATSGEPRSRKSTRNLMLASQMPIGVYDVMADPTKMKALDYYATCVAAICGVYGVQPLFISQMTMQTRGGNTPIMQLQVNNRTIQDLQGTILESLNNQLFPIFGITDWTIEFGAIEEKDVLRDAQIMDTKAAAAVKFASVGFDVKILDNGDLEVSGTSKTPQEMAPKQDESPGKIKTGKEAKRQGAKVSDASGQIINETTVERDRNDPRAE